MVGEEVVRQSSDVNTLQEGAGEKRVLKPRGNFERNPHLWTYFIRGPEGIKIGRSGSPKLRMSRLQPAHASKLELILAIPYDQLSEPDAHAKFKHLNLHGEWFRADRELLHFIECAKLKYGEAAPHKPVPRRPPSPKAAKQPTAIHKLSALRVVHGADTPIGHRCSGLMKMIPTLQESTDPDQRAFLVAGIKRATAELAKLVAAAA